MNVLNPALQARFRADVRAVLRMGYFIVRGPGEHGSLPWWLTRKLYETGGADHQRSLIEPDEGIYWERYRLTDKGRALLEGYAK